MDLFDKYMMRASGEKKHQPASNTEMRVLATLDRLMELDWFSDNFHGMTEQEKRELLEKMHDADTRATNR